MIQNLEGKQLTTSAGAFQIDNETESVSSEDTNNNMTFDEGEDTNETKNSQGSSTSTDSNLAYSIEKTDGQPEPQTVPQQYRSSDKPSLSFKENMYFQVKLMHILEEANAQHYLYHSNVIA